MLGVEGRMAGPSKRQRRRIAEGLDVGRARALIALGALLGALGVAAGAFGAHGLEGAVTPERLETFGTAARYHLIHALALVLVGTIGLFASRTDATNLPSRWLSFVGYLFVGGVVLFSGSLYLLVLTDTPWLGAITPLGGVCFIAGWLLLSITALKSTSPTVHQPSDRLTD